MTTTMTPTERLERMDREVEDLKQSFVDAATELSHTPEVDSSHDERWTAIVRRLDGLRTELRPEDYDKEQVFEFFAALLDIKGLMEEPRTLDTIDQLLLYLERIRHVVRDALDEHVAGVGGDVGLVVEELLARLPGIKRDAIAELVDVDRRTLARWTQQSGPPGQRLAAVARLVAILRHNWTPDGVIAWFYRPRRDLDGKKPIAVLANDRFDEDVLVAAARAGRSQYAS